MSTFIVKFIANRLLKDNQWNKFGVEDPFYEYVPVHVNEKSGKTSYKKVTRRVPQGLSANDEKVLNSVRKRAYRYDMWFQFMGVKFGWTNIVGFVPIVGTLVSTYWSLGLLWSARQLDDGLPFDLQLLYLLNIAIDFLLGLIPFVGDLIEVGYKSNSRNFLLLEKHLDRVGQKNMGLISPEEVRPGFINDKVKPMVDESIVPGAKLAGEKIKSFIHDHSASSSGVSTPKLKSSVASATTSTAPTTVSGSVPDAGSDAATVASSIDGRSKKSI
ncbi:hypothetical protein PGUG_03189 [Meyerozyma guilliermondii ATCC 6260]|uniref:Uncharacterized protein n=1 Tax=Meyerozyma guilliermondii (strain ATCC 6260 / CBS 566 / DSM 6381 / JCM 1539 / NBRC 10279 / NRRL Y-324) TaxID=294746 RepID=A5DIT8_PICGU|nr:uncharacterized protein PGUG_03189 [Meyerozyma guilliermondii ATCC 6260]EDK39091.2 hypothetical protein PGUG_03189 [Meyerozyma guilliermondii ATCC 6260]